MAPTKFREISAFASALREQRRRRSQTIGDVAKALLLSDKQIIGLESDDLSYFYTRAYAERAALSYAKLVAVDLALSGAPPYESMKTLPDHKRVLINKNGKKKALLTRLSIPTIAIGVLIILTTFLIASFIFNSIASKKSERKLQLSSQSRIEASENFIAGYESIADLKQKNALNTDNSEKANSLSRPTIVPSVVAPIRSNNLKKIKQTTTSSNSSEKSTRFFIVINRSTSINARDARGRLLLAGEQAPTKGKRISGTPPFFISVSNPDAVSIYYLGNRIRPGRTNIDGIRVTAN